MDGNAASALVRNWMASIIESRPDVIALALKQRAKFEGWLKFELASLSAKTAQGVVLEPPLPSGASRADLGVTIGGRTWFIELKTANTNWRMAGVEDLSRPVTKNISGIVEDGEKMRAANGGIVGFVLFPIPTDDSRWTLYLCRVGDALGVALSESDHCRRVSVALDSGHTAQLVVCAFAVGGPR